MDPPELVDAMVNFPPALLAYSTRASKVSHSEFAATAITLGSSAMTHRGVISAHASKSSAPLIHWAPHVSAAMDTRV